MHGTSGLSGRRTASLIAGALALTSAVGAIAFEVSSRTTYEESKNEGDDGRQDSLYDSANRKYKVAQALAVGALACTSAAIALWLTGDSDPEGDRGVAVAPVPTEDSFSVVVSGRF